MYRTLPGCRRTGSNPHDLEIQRILAACRSPSDRVIVAVLYGTGGRIGEIARLRWRDVVFDEHGVRVLTHDTTENRVRYARGTWARGMLAAWKDVYQLEAVPDGLVFISSRNDAMDYDRIRHRLVMAARPAGVTRGIHTPLFRKSRITHTIQQDFQESINKQMMWANLNTQEFRTNAVLCEAGIRRKGGIHGSARAAAVPAVPYRRRAGIPVLLHLRPGPDGRGRDQARGREADALGRPGHADRAGSGDPGAGSAGGGDFADPVPQVPSAPAA